KPGEATIVHELLYDQSETVNGYFNYGPTGDNQVDHFQDFSQASSKSTTLGGVGSSRTELTDWTEFSLFLRDGQNGDNDLDAENGAITHFGGPISGISGSESHDSTGGGCFLEVI
ncbi:MAG: hypothetical protein V1816_27470, partial [Pseudomonadota bacterium]